MLLVASVAGCLLWGVAATWTAAARLSAANAIVASAGPLTYDAQQAYQSLSDAAATEANAYLSGATTASAVTRLQADVRQAEADVMAVRAGDPEPAVQGDLTALATGVPIYANYVGEADAFNDQDDLVGAAWLGDASNLMSGKLLPAASDLYDKENARLGSDYAGATSIPYLAAGAAVVLAAAAFWGQRWLARRTRRVLNLGLLAASLIGLLSACWLLAALFSARSDLLAGRDHGSGPAHALAQAEVTVLQMHSDESLTLINRDGPADATETAFRQRLWPLLRAQLATAATQGAGSPGAADASAAARGAAAWDAQAGKEFTDNDDGSYSAAVAVATGPATSAFESVDRDLSAAITADQAASARQAASGDGALGGLLAVTVIAALAMAAASAWGVGQRIAEYR